MLTVPTPAQHGESELEELKDQLTQYPILQLKNMRTDEAYPFMREHTQKELTPRRANSDPKSREIRELLDPSQAAFVERPLRKSSVLLSAGGGRMKKAF